MSQKHLAYTGALLSNSLNSSIREIANATNFQAVFEKMSAHHLQDFNVIIVYPNVSLPFQYLPVVELMNKPCHHSRRVGTGGKCFVWLLSYVTQMNK